MSDLQALQNEIDLLKAEIENSKSRMKYALSVVNDTRDQLVTSSHYSIDEWSSPAINLKNACNALRRDLGIQEE